MKQKKYRNGESLWATPPTGLEKEPFQSTLLAAAARLPFRYWKERLYFFGPNDDLWKATNQRFPRNARMTGMHPVFSLWALAGDIGFRVCPCTSKKPYDKKSFHFIQKDCILSPTGYKMPKDSFIIDALNFNIPITMAERLRFKGEVPRECIRWMGHAKAK